MFCSGPTCKITLHYIIKHRHLTSVNVKHVYIVFFMSATCKHTVLLKEKNVFHGHLAHYIEANPNLSPSLQMPPVPVHPVPSPFSWPTV